MEPLSFSSVTKMPAFGEVVFIEDIAGYQLVLGVGTAHAQEIVVNSNDPHDISLQRHTSDARRFANIERLKAWYDDHGRYTFTLVTPEGVIAGIWWGRPSETPTVTEYISDDMRMLMDSQIHNMHTSGIRIYPIARSKGLAGLLLARSTFYYRMIYPEACICVDVDQENIPSQKIFIKQGYAFVGYGENKKTVNNTLTPRLVYLEVPDR